MWQEDRGPGRFIVRSAAYALLVTLTVFVALIGIFLVPSGPIIWGQDTSVAWPFAILGNLLLVRATRYLDEWSWSPFIVAVAWIGTVLVLSTGRPEGDIIVPADAPGLLFLFLGAASLFGAIIQDHRSRRRIARQRRKAHMMFHAEDYLPR